MEINTFTNLISTVGFPIACVIAMGVFLGFFIKKYIEQNEANNKSLQERANEREDKLYLEMGKQNEINKEAIETIALYADRLAHIENDVADIKDTVNEIKLK